MIVLTNTPAFRWKNALIGCSMLFVVSCAPEHHISNSDKMSDDALLQLVQEGSFQYFWKGAETYSGLARERIHLDEPELDRHLITSGGSGFGLMALIVGIERAFISREEGIERLEKMIGFLEGADRFHGVWPHWMDGRNGKVIPFSPKDNGGDLVETAYLAQGLLCVRQYLNTSSEKEALLIARIQKLWEEIEWSWYQQHGKDMLYWHWSPEYEWEMNFAIEGYNECLITYVLAASSPNYPIPASAYHRGWARGGAIQGNYGAYELPLSLKHNGAETYGGPLFWSHYSFLGLDPRELNDSYANYWDHNKNHSLINYQWCVNNPAGFKGYGPNCWGLTASYSTNFYDAHRPDHDKGVISPTAALSSFPYTPVESMAACRYFYEELGNKLWGKYGFYDAFSLEEDWFPHRYLAIDQGPIVIMIENYRTGLLWDLFMSCQEVQTGLDKLGFQYE